MNLDFLRTRRHTHIEDFIGFSNELSSLIGAKPAIFNLIVDPILAYHYFIGPLTSYQHRLVGPNKWTNARSAIISASKKNNTHIPFSVIFLILAILSAFMLKMII